MNFTTLNGLAQFTLMIWLVTCCRPGGYHVAPGTYSNVVETYAPVDDHDTTKWKELTTAMGFYVDIRYATKNNFVKEVIYPCGRCFLKPQAADALKQVNAQLAQKGYSLKVFDCYRPSPAQQKLWDKVPDRNYVAPPWEGSMHSRGMAVDLTIVNSSGDELDMGTTYDFFGPAAHHTYTDLSKTVLANRALLKKTMEANGFQSIRTEWWHYSLRGQQQPLSDWQWSCDN